MWTVPDCSMRSRPRDTAPGNLPAMPTASRSVSRRAWAVPMGSILIGDSATIYRARRARKTVWRRPASGRNDGRIGHLCDGLPRRTFAGRPSNARVFAEAISQIEGIRLNVDHVETNLVFFEVDAKRGTSAQLSARLLQHGVKLNPSGTQRLRACTHLDVTKEDVLQAAEAVRACMEGDISQANGAHLAGSAYASR